MGLEMMSTRFRPLSALNFQIDDVLEGFGIPGSPGPGPGLGT